MSNASLITPIRAMYAAQRTLYCINIYSRLQINFKSYYF